MSATSDPVSGTKLWLVQWKAFRAMRDYDLRSIEKTGLGLSDFAVLEILLHKGSQPVNAIGRKVQLTSGSITSAVDRLEDKGLVRRRKDREDGRVTWVDLTSRGRTLISKAFVHHAARLEQAVSVLDDRERVVLAGLLKKLGRHAETLV